MFNVSAEAYFAAAKIQNAHRGPVIRACKRLHDQGDHLWLARRLRKSIARQDDQYLAMVAALYAAHCLEAVMSPDNPQLAPICAYLHAGNEFRKNFHENWIDITPIHTPKS